MGLSILAQHTYKHQYDKTITRPPHKYALGEKIWLFVPYIHKLKHHKLTPQWTGPKYISRIHDNGTYHVRNCIDDRETGPINHRRLTIFQDPQAQPFTLQLPHPYNLTILFVVTVSINRRSVLNVLCLQPICMYICIYTIKCARYTINTLLYRPRERALLRTYYTSRSQRKYNGQ
jgi:hypothetical protein